MPRRNYSSTAVATTLTSSINNAVTSIPVAATTGFPGSTPFTLILDEGTASEEIITVTAVAGLNLTATRGQDGTTAVSHSSGATVKHGVSARDFDEPNSFLNLGGTVGGNTTITGTIAASGLAGSLLSSTSGAALGTAAAGSSTIPARADHVHSPDSTSATLTTPTISGTATNSGTISGGDLSGNRFISPEEKWNVSATAVTTTTTVDYLTAQNWYYTTTSTAGACTINIRGNSGTTLSSLLVNVGDSVTFSFAIATGATTPAYFNAVQIDGTVTGVTVRWQYGTTPTSGTTSGTDMYSFTVIKTAATPTYTVFASVSKW